LFHVDIHIVPDGQNGVGFAQNGNQIEEDPQRDEEFLSSEGKEDRRNNDPAYQRREKPQNLCFWTLFPRG
jgi:hypothetical protein